MRCLTVKLIAMLLCVGSVHAAVYEWVDDKGVVNFTDNREKIPQKYRGTAVERDMSGSSKVTITKDDIPSISPAETKGTPKSLYGGHDLRWWQTEIANVRKEIGLLEEQLPAKKQELSQIHRKRVLYQKSSDRVAYYRISDEINAGEARLKELQEKLAALLAEADRAGVPQEVR